MAGAEILEGFLCPICVQDLGSLAQLHDHFDLAHVGEDKALLNQIKGLFGKAKRKFLRKETESDGVDSPASMDIAAAASAIPASFGGLDPSWWDPQEPGTTRSLTDSFKLHRSLRIDRFIIETNKLLIRLDKLVNSDFAVDASKRKAFEKSVVPWAPDSDVNLCMTCGKSFMLTRRRHHCRLCGRIVCNKCSHFLPFDLAKKLTNPAFSYEGDGFHRSGSNSSLNSIFGPEGDMHIRTCDECRFLLERRDEQMSQRTIKPVIVQLYERVRTYMNEAEQVLPLYSQMANSLNAGETTHDLNEAQKLRSKLGKAYENIRTLNKRIAVLGLDNPQPPTPRSLRLQQMISAHASAFLQENLLGLPSLPTEDELAKLQTAKRVEAQQRIADEKRVAAERERRKREEQLLSEELERTANAAVRRNSTRDSATLPTRVRFDPKSGDLVGLAAGWKPTEVAQGRTTSSDDPMVQQMNIIRGYIRQAKDAGKWDEVQMLQENLKELQLEFWEQQKQKKPPMTNAS